MPDSPLGAPDPPGGNPPDHEGPPPPRLLTDAEARAMRASARQSLRDGASRVVDLLSSSRRRW